MPILYNIHEQSLISGVFIGRGSLYGNPYRIGIDGDRDQVCDLYEKMIMERPKMMNRIKKNLRGKDLMCFCTPKRCHGDFLLRIANEESD